MLAQSIVGLLLQRREPRALECAAGLVRDGRTFGEGVQENLTRLPQKRFRFRLTGRSGGSWSSMAVCLTGTELLRQLANPRRNGAIGSWSARLWSNSWVTMHNGFSERQLVYESER